jgi:multidrug efflux pump subunit AcrA (membrane-fusion protein)
MPIAVAVLTGLLLSGCKDKPQGPAQVPAKTPPPMEVGTITVTAQSLPLTIELPGRIAALRVAEVRPQVSGIVQKRLFIRPRWLGPKPRWPRPRPLSSRPVCVPSG